jgi:hypothetical protein
MALISDKWGSVFKPDSGIVKNRKAVTHDGVKNIIFAEIRAASFDRRSFL